MVGDAARQPFGVPARCSSAMVVRICLANLIALFADFQLPTGVNAG